MVSRFDVPASRLAVVVVHADNRAERIKFFDVEERDEYINDLKTNGPPGAVVCIEGSPVAWRGDVPLARQWEISDAFEDQDGLPVFKTIYVKANPRPPACAIDTVDADLLVIEFDRVADRAGLLHRDVPRYPALLRAAGIDPAIITPAIIARAAAYDRAELKRICAAAGASLKIY